VGPDTRKEDHRLRPKMARRAQGYILQPSWDSTMSPSSFLKMAQSETQSTRMGRHRCIELRAMGTTRLWSYYWRRTRGGRYTSLYCALANGKSAPRNYWRSSRKSQKKFSTGSLTSKLLNLNALVGQQASGGCKEAISMFINLGTNMDTPVGFIADHYCWTLLHIAVRWKHPGVPQLLLEKGANRYARDSDGEFPKIVAEKLNDSQLKACFAITKSCILEN